MLSANLNLAYNSWSGLGMLMEFGPKSAEPRGWSSHVVVTRMAHHLRKSDKEAQQGQ